MVINEIMYHVRATEWKEDPSAEFIELYHSGDQAVSLENWRFAAGVRYSFPAITVEPGDYVVVAADVEAFRRIHPEVKRVLGPFRGRLSNSGERLMLEDADGKTVDELSYADSGRWAKRESVRTKGFEDWVWTAPHDGEGYSLSLISPTAANEYGANWRPSLTMGGTPGEENGDVRVASVPPVVASLEHSPAIPHSNEPVTVRVGVGHGPEVTVMVRFRQDGDVAFQSVPVVEGRAVIPPMPDKTVVQYYAEVEDIDGLRATYPPVILRSEGRLAKRQALQLYQVDDAFNASEQETPGHRPTYRMVTTADEIRLLRQLSSMSGRSMAYDNHLHVTFMVTDGMETTVKHHVSARIRGHGSRSKFPPGLRVSFPSDDRWRGVADINLNSQNPHAQALGAAIHQVVGVAAAARSTPTYLRINGEDWTEEGAPQFGCYVHNEVLDDEFVAAHLPGEEEGNLYRLVASAYLNERESSSSFRREYDKRNHGAEDDYSDIAKLIETLRQTTPAKTYFDRVNEVMNIEQWARYIAVDALLGNTEGGMPQGRGDDVALFRGRDGRFQLIPYDLDSILGMGDDPGSPEMEIYGYGRMSGLRQLFQEPRFLKLFSQQFIHLTDTVYRPEILNRVIDDLWQGWIPAKEVDKVKSFLAQRIEYVLSQIHSPTIIGSTLEREKGFYRASSTDFAFYGRYDRGAVHEVRVGGRAPKVFPRTGMWIMPPDRLKELVRPGVNQIPVVTLDAEGNVVEEKVVPVWLDRGEVKRVRGSLPAGETITWTSGEGPYLLEEAVFLPESSRLVIEDGTTVYGSATGRLVVEGGLEIRGEPVLRVTFAKAPNDEGSSGWAGIEVRGEGAGEVIMSHADFLDLNGSIEISGRRARLEEVKIDWIGGQGLRARDSDLWISGELRQRLVGEDADPIIEVKGGSLQLLRAALLRQGGGPAIEVEGTSSCYLFGNLFEQGSSPVIALGGDGFVDGNDFSVSATASRPVVETKATVVFTRNRVFGEAPLSDPGLKVSQGDNSRFKRRQAKRNLPVAEARFLKQPLARTSDTPLKLLIGGSGLAAFRYQLDQEAWSEPIDVAGESGYELVLHAEPGVHQVRLIGRHLSGRWQPEAGATVSRVFEVVSGLPPVIISEVLALNDTAHRLDGDDSDYVELYNYGTQEFDLSDFGLSDDPERPRKYVFPAGTLLDPGRYLVLAADRRGLGFALNGAGETLVLTDREGGVVDRVTFGLQLADHSISRLDDNEWGLSKPTPGAGNEGVALAGPEALGLSEWLAVVSVSSPDEFIELANASDRPVNISGFTLTDRIPNKRVWRPLPPLSYLAPQSYRAFYTDSDPEKGSDHLSFRLANEGEVIGLIDDRGVLLDFAVFGPQMAGVSQVRDRAGALSYARPSPGRAGRRGMGEGPSPLLGAIRIAEIHYHPSANDDEEFVELINIAEEPVDLGGLAFTEGIDFTFADARLAAGARVVVVKDRGSFRRRYGGSIPIAGEYDGRLSNGGERLSLTTREGQTVVEFEYGDKWHRSTDGRGYSLTIVDPKASRIDSRRAWKPSDEIGGTPGR